MKRAGFLFLVFLFACASGPPPADWMLNASAALKNFTQSYLIGDSRLAELEFSRVKSEISSSGRPDLLARAELVRCAARAASLEFDACPGFEALRKDAAAEELAYAEYLAGQGERAAADDPLSKLVFSGIRLRKSQITPLEIAAAVETASAQGWRRPLLAWLGVQERRTEAAGDREALERIRRRIAFVSGKT